ncbi:hypothetical protein FA95DRAFT_1195705 [Auriscalpium vulgare]|uniref:Uncharacterized protein n=1 Tax=Auriscalpium vulgare TaxID=40419 RepID=A0ACB8RV53_9AGAM|nr:hypothetical protein FA95DRAFT_1195705 [Auriscalpium vulgare]
MQVLEYTSLDSLTAAAALLTQHLNSTSEISRQIRSSQGSAARSTANLAETLQMLTLTAHGALDDLNDTAFAMKGALSTGYGGSWGSVLGAVDGNSWTIFLSPCGGLDMPLITKDLLTGFFLVARLGELLARMAAGYLWGLLWFLIRQAMLSPVLAAMFLASFSVTRQPRTAAHPHQPPLAVYAPARCHGPCAHQLHGTNFAWRRPARFSRIPPPDRIGRPPGFYDGAVGS